MFSMGNTYKNEEKKTKTGEILFTRDKCFNTADTPRHFFPSPVKT